MGTNDAAFCSLGSLSDMLGGIVNELSDSVLIFQVEGSRLRLLEANLSAIETGLVSEDDVGRFCEDLPAIVSGTLRGILERTVSDQKTTRCKDVLAEDGFIGDFTAIPVNDKEGNCSYLVLIGRQVVKPSSNDQSAQFSKAREYIVKRIERFGSRAFAVLYTDVDRLILINETFGHSTGDFLLRQMEERLKVYAKAVFRQNGDEFITILEDANEKNVYAFAQDILKRLSDPYKVEGKEIYITISLGISLYPRHGEDAESLLKYAETALYNAKQKGRNTYDFYSEDIQKRNIRFLKMQKELRDAWTHSEFILYYQPKVEIKSGIMVGVEALLRWKHPEKGVIPPNEFIPLLEETGLIVPVGEWVLRTACLQNKAWQSLKLDPMVMSVNLSVRQFSQDNMVNAVYRILMETGLRPEYLDLEITESMAFQNIAESENKMLQLKELGISLSLDDFGTGYSSLSYLKHLPFDAVKIDRSFIKNTITDNGDRSIVKAIISVARNLGKKVVAEGVETYRHFDFLKEAGCDLAQGYLFGRPMPAQEITHILMAEPLVRKPSSLEDGFLDWDCLQAGL